MSRDLFRRTAWAAACGLCVSVAQVATVQAQPPGGGPGGPGGGPGGEGGPPRTPPPFMAALDVNSDGVLDQDEIEMAAESLKTLDKDKDGKLQMAELMPPQRGFGGGPGGPGGGFGGGPGGPGGGPGGMMDFATLDKNSDGSISKEEFPERMRDFFGRVDTNSDGKISKEEMDEMRNRMSRGFGGGGGAPGGGFDLMSLDADKDGFITKEEAPERMRENFDRMDTNKDGKISKEEVEEIRARMGRGGPGGQGGPGGGRDGNRPRRPDEA